MSMKGLRIMNFVVLIVGFNMVSGNFFQCLGMVRISIFLSLSRQLLFLVPLVYLLPLALGQNGVWFSFPIADSISTLLCAFFVIRLFKKFDRLKDGDDPSILGSTIKS